MTRYKYLVVGGGMAADAATRGIRDVDPDGTIGLIGAEADPPYKRPYLSKKLWQGKPESSIWSKTESRGAALHLGRSVVRVDPWEKCVLDDQGYACGFEKLLLATGGTPRRLPFGDDRVIYLRSVEDYRRLRDLAGRLERFAVIGGGFIATEIAAALRSNGNEVTMIFPGEAIGSRLYPRDLALFLNDYYRERGVHLYPGRSVTGIEEGSDGLTITTGGGARIAADGVVAGIGITPNTRLAEESGLEVRDGIVVDEHLRTSNPDVYAAGDVATYPDWALGKRRRVEHEDNALTMGRLAGRNMAGHAEPYHNLPFFYSDLFDLGYEAVGEVDASLRRVVDWREPHREGVVYYLDEGRVRGILLWNVWGQVDAARELISQPGVVQAAALVGRLGNAS